MGIWETLTSLFGWSREEAEAEASEIELIVSDVELAFDSGDLSAAAEAVDELEELATHLGVELDDVTDDYAELLISLLPDWRAERELEIEYLADQSGYEDDDFVRFAADLGAETDGEISVALDLYYEQQYELTAIFETPGEALAYVEGVTAGVLEIIEGDDGLYYVYRTYKD